MTAYVPNAATPPLPPKTFFHTSSEVIEVLNNMRAKLLSKIDFFVIILWMIYIFIYDFFWMHESYASACSAFTCNNVVRIEINYWFQFFQFFNFILLTFNFNSNFNSFFVIFYFLFSFFSSVAREATSHVPPKPVQEPGLYDVRGVP